MKTLNYYIILLILLSASVQGTAQDVMDKPYAYSELQYDVINQRYYFEGNPYASYTLIPDKKANKNRKWNVITTQAETPILDKPNGTKTTTVGFSTFFYVRKVDGDFLEVTSNLSGKSLGWCHKDNLILWNNPLVDNSTGIELKAFMVNNFIGVENLKLIRANKEFYQVYDGPGKDAKPLAPRLIYDVFFVFKYINTSGERGKGRFLVSQYYDLNDNSPLLGWVDEGRTEIWKTALCLEPNFDKPALEERAQKDIIATVFTSDFGGVDQVEKYRATGARGSALVGGPLRDPALGNYELHPRMDGEIFRYPVFNGVRYPDNSKIFTAVTGKTNLGNSGVVEGFDDAVYTQISKKSKELAENMKFKNVVFLLDGSDGTKRYFDVVIDFLNKAYESNVASGINTTKYGAVLYKNEFPDNTMDANPESQFCRIFDLSTNAKELAKKLSEYPIGEAGFKTEGEAVYYGMKKAILMLVPNQSNVVIHIGNAPDNSSVDPWFKSQKPETMLSPIDLGDILKNNEIDLNYINFIGFSKEVSAGTRKLFYENQCDEILPELATSQANKYFGIEFVISNTQPETPVLTKTTINGAKVARMTKSAFQIKSYYLDDYNESLVSNYLALELDSCALKTKEFLSNLKEIVEDESALNDRASDFKIPVLSLIIDELIKNDVNNEQFLNDFREWCAAEKVQLFIKSNTYYKCDKLKYPLFKYVLFMHEDKLSSRLADLRKLTGEFRNETQANVQASLGKYWSSLAETVLGGDKKYENITIEELRKRLLGIENMNLMLPSDLEQFGGLTVGEIMSKKKLSDVQIDQLMNYFKTAYSNLQEIYNGDVYYQIEGTNSKFYWVPLEYVFG